MAKLLQMGDLVTRCQRRCDKEFDGSISPAEWYSLVSEQYGELWTEVAGTGCRYFETKFTIVANGASSYQEPQDVLATVGVDFVDATGKRRSLIERMAQERQQYQTVVGDAREYALVDDRLYLFPSPASGSYEWMYIPQPTDLTTYIATDVVDLVNPHGLTFVLWGVAAKALAKAEKMTDGAIAERDAARERLVDWANKRSMYSAKRRIVQREHDFDEWDC